MYAANRVVRGVLAVALTLVLMAGTGAVGTVAADGPEVTVDVPRELVTDHDNEIRLNVTGGPDGELEIRVFVDGALVYSDETADRNVSFMYEPTEMGGKNLTAVVEPAGPDGPDTRAARVRVQRFIEHRRVLDHRVWNGVAAPIPDTVEEEVRRIAEENYSLNDSLNMFWGPTDGDGTMYVQLTPKDVRYGSMRLVGSLPTNSSRRRHELSNGLVVCFYNANYLTFYESPDVVLPTNESLEHADNVVVDGSLERIGDVAHRYVGDATERDVVLVDHADVIGTVSGDAYVRGAVIDVPFADTFYERIYGLDADTYVLPLEVLTADEVPKVTGNDRILSDREDARVLINWVESDRTFPASADRKEDRFGEPGTAEEDPQRGSPPADGDGPDGSDGGEPEDQGLAVTIVAAAVCLAGLIVRRR